MKHKSSRAFEIAKAAKQTKTTTLEVNRSDAVRLGIAKAASKSEGSLPADNGHPYVALKYFDNSFECFSEWQREELEKFSEFLNKLRQSSWQQIFEQGGKIGNKTGFALTYHRDLKKLPASRQLEQISEDIQVFELRVSQKARVHGFRVTNTFFLIWLDRNHRVCPM